jgi:hypothetical protein
VAASPHELVNPVSRLEFLHSGFWLALWQAWQCHSGATDATGPMDGQRAELDGWPWTEPFWILILDGAARHLPPSAIRARALAAA